MLHILQHWKNSGRRESLMDEQLKGALCGGQQGRARGENMWYAPARDISCLLPILVSEAFKEWEREGNPYAEEAKELGITDDDICQVATALGAFFSQESIVELKSFEESFGVSGLKDIPTRKRMFVLSMLGDMMLAAFWYGVRTATTISDDVPQMSQYNPKELVVESRKLSGFLRLNKLSQALHRLKRKFIKE